MSSHRPDIESLFHEGVRAVRAGDRAAAREKLMRVVEQDELHEQAWVWLSAVVDTDEERIVCLENALTINPHSEAARRGLKKLGVDAPPPPETAPAAPVETPRLEHGAPSGIDAGLHALLTGAPKPEALPEKPALPESEAWRAPLLEAEHTVSTATIARPVEPEPTPSFSDLAATWVDLLYFNIHGGFKQEVNHGSFTHVLVNIAVAAGVQIVSAVVLAVMLFVIPQGNFRPPLLASLSEMFESWGGVEMEIGPNSPAAGILTLMDTAGMPIPAGTQTVLPASTDPQVQALLQRITGSLGLFLLAYAVLIVVVLLAEQMYSALMVQAVAGGLMHGGGDTGKGLHTLTLALVAGSLAQLPVMLVLPFVPATPALAIVGGLQVYRLMITATAVGTTYRLNLAEAIGALVMSAAIGSGLLAGLALIVRALLR
jgi:hypothetical protein